MKKICQLQPGDIFTWMDTRFVVLEHQDDGTMVLTKGKIGNSPFQSEDIECPNDYSVSIAKNKIDNFTSKLVDGCGVEDAIIPFEVNLRPTDMSDTGYGEITVLAAPLTLWQYGKYKSLIPRMDGWWWLVTPMHTPWSSLHCNCNDTPTHVLLVDPDGYWCHGSCMASSMLRPTLKLNSKLLVSVDEADESCGECNFDLRRVNSADLLSELKRRLEDSCENIVL